MVFQKSLNIIKDNIKAFITAFLFLLLFLPLSPNLISELSANPYYSHGFLIPLICAYFIWNKRSTFQNVPAYPSPAGLVFVFAGSALYVVARLSNEFVVQCFALVIVLFGIVYAHFGWEVVRKASFSIFYLIFMIPLPKLISATMTFHLGLFSTKLAYFFIRLLGISATRQGNIINLPTAVLTVGAPCSGLRGLISYIVGALAIGYLFQKKIINRILLVLISVILTIVMNTIRLVVLALIVTIGRLPEIPTVAHDVDGLVILVIGLFILFKINDLLAGNDEQKK